MYYNINRFFVFYIVTALTNSANLFTSATPGSRIVGGTVISIDQAPYIVQLRENDEYTCGGTLISTKHVVTAAHCFDDTDIEDVVVVGGATTTTEKGVQRRIANVTIHPEYNADSSHTDIAIIELKTEMKGQHTTTAPLCERNLTESDFVQVSGWGQLTEENEDMPEELRTVRLPVRSKEVCVKEFKRFVEKNMFCASGYEKKGFCFGDSGGPAIHDGQLCGIAAFVYNCGVVGKMSAFTDVYALRSFIEKVTNK